MHCHSGFSAVEDLNKRCESFQRGDFPRHVRASDSTLISGEVIQLIKQLDRSTKVGNDDRSSDDQSHVEDFPNLLTAASQFTAPDHVIRDAVVAPEHHRRGKSGKLFGLFVQGAGCVGLGIKGEESIGDQVLLIENPLVHLLPEGPEFSEAAHSPSMNEPNMRQLTRGR